MSQLFRRLRYLLNRRRFDRELAGDLEFHREMSARGGGAPLGNALLLREEARDAWGWTWIDRLGQDLRYAARVLRRSPGFTVAAVLMLAIGIGVNVAAFGFFNLILFKPLQVRDPRSLLRFHRRGMESFAYALPYPEMGYFREYSKTLSSVIAASPAGLAADGEEHPIHAEFVTSNFFTDLGADARIGRTFGPAQTAEEPVAVLGNGFWQRHFGSDPSIIGRAIRLNGKPVTVIGIAPNEFSGLSLDSPDAWLPIVQQPYFVTGSQLLTDYSVESTGVRMWGRLRPGLNAKAAEDELAGLAAQLRKQHPNEIWEKEALPSDPGGYAKSLLIGNRRGTGAEGRDQFVLPAALMGTLTLLILAVACGNLGSLLLARGVAREREISIRAAVGAGKARLVRQLFTESLVLAMLGSAAGLGLGSLVLRGMFLMTDSPAWLSTAPDWRVVVFAAGMGFASAILFGLTPALQIARQRHRATALRQILVGAQVAASCVLLIVAGLLVRALQTAATENPGFEYSQVVSIDPGLASHGYTAAGARAYFSALEGRLRGLAGVESLSLASLAPLGNGVVSVGAGVDGHPLEIHPNRVDPGFLQTMTIPLLRGRDLRAGDLHAMVVSESFARRAWPGRDALGKSFSDDVVVGIAGSARWAARENGEAVEAYYPVREEDMPSMVLLVKTKGEPEGVLPFMAAMARGIDPKIFPETQLMKSSFKRKLKSAESTAFAVSVMGFAAQLLACIGVVGLVAYAVSQRTKEIGIRMALGAKTGDVLAIVLRQFSRPLAVGLMAGVGAAAALSQVLRKELYGVSNLDPFTYAVAIGVFAATVAVAALIPARRALKVDPMVALRYD